MAAGRQVTLVLGLIIMCPEHLYVTHYLFGLLDIEWLECHLWKQIPE
jgi:hypothetical protein